ncbi:MAG: histidinol dehydrogenase [Anaerolineales bacterium]|nr:histidinol dehydrogenase [Anaerolineales bacterium]
MLQIYDVETARAGILNRDDALDVGVPEGLQRGIEAMFGERLTPEQVVRRILADVRKRGDTAVREWTARIDGVELESILLNPETITAGAKRIEQAEPELYSALKKAADRIRLFHQCQPLPNWTTDKLGGTLGQRATPIARVGVYVPGGTAPLPSSLLMSVIPAQVAGVSEIVVATPPGKSGGAVPDVILAAAHIVGVDNIVTLGGAQAIGALAFGTDSLRRVDKIVGAGNLFVTLAKREVYGRVGIDGLYGPTETVVVADDTAVPAWVAADLLAQAEHDVLATAILITPSRVLAEAVQVEIGRQLETLSRPEIITQSLAGQGGIVLTASVAEACALASEFAAEHTCIATENPAQYQDLIPNAGGLFIGERSFEVLGDYVAGPSHVMPTSGTARFASPLNVLDFVKISSLIALDDETTAVLAPLAARIAQAEALTAHANAAQKRVEI